MTTVESISERFRTASVALVGNSNEAKSRDLGGSIDGHDIVIRMNAGAPGEDDRFTLGERTDILAVGTRQCFETSMALLDGSATQTWFWKSTRLGNKQWLELEGDYPSWDLWRVPPGWEEGAREEVGAPPSGGMGLIHAIMEHMRPRQLSVFNIDFFGALAGDGKSWWHEERPEAVICKRHPHNGTLELAYFKRLGFRRVEDGWWRR